MEVHGAIAIAIKAGKGRAELIFRDAQSDCRSRVAKFAKAENPVTVTIGIAKGRLQHGTVGRLALDRHVELH